MRKFTALCGHWVMGGLSFPLNMLMKRLFLGVVAAVAFAWASQATPQPNADAPILTIAATGDAMSHMAILRCAKRNDRGALNHNGFDYLFERLKPYTTRADIATVNAEFPSPNKIRHGRVMMVFGAPFSQVQALAWAGFTVANLANNHAFDQGIEGVAETAEAFENAGIKTVGAGRDLAEAEKVVVIERKGIKVAFIGACKLLSPRANLRDPSRPHVIAFELERMVEWIRKARAAADVVVVHVHWSAEGHEQAGERERRDAIAMMEAGADLIVGHHPHVLQPVITYTASDGRRCIAAMSLGNLISNQRPGYRYGSGSRYGDPRDGALLRVTFQKQNGRVMLLSWDAVPLWTWNDRYDPDNRVKYPWNIQVWPIPDAIEKINASLAQLDVRSAQKKYLITMRQDLAWRAQRILKHLGAPNQSPIQAGRG